MIASNGAGPHLICIHEKFANKASVRADISHPAQTTVLYNTVNPFLIAIVNRLFIVTNSGLLQQNYMQATHQYQ